MADGSLLTNVEDPDATIIIAEPHRLQQHTSVTQRDSGDRSRTTSYITLVLIFLILAGVATLFPPFHWEAEAGKPIPVSIEEPRKYAFILGESTQQKFSYEFDGSDSSEAVTFRRSLNVTELILEYIIAFVVALLIQVVLLKAKARIKGKRVGA